MSRKDQQLLVPPTGTGGGTGNLATVNDEDKNTDLKLLLHLAYPFKGGKNRSDISQVILGERG